MAERRIWADRLVSLVEYQSRRPHRVAFVAWCIAAPAIVAGWWLGKMLGWLH